MTRRRIPHERRRSQRSPIGWAISLVAKDLRRCLGGAGGRGGPGWREFDRLFPPGSEVARRLERFEHLTAHDGRDYLVNRSASDARALRARLLVLVWLEQSRQDRTGVVARGRGLWFGRTATRRKDGSRVRPEQRQGLSARLRGCAKTVQRLWRRLEGVGLGRAHQPREKGGRAPERLPEYMRGRDFAYLVWTWAVPLPRPAAAAAWGGRESTAPAATSPPRPTSERAAALSAELMALVERS